MAEATLLYVVLCDQPKSETFPICVCRSWAEAEQIRQRMMRAATRSETMPAPQRGVTFRCAEAVLADVDARVEEALLKSTVWPKRGITFGRLGGL